MQEQKDQHLLGYPALAKVLVALFILTAVTVGVSRFDFGALNVWVSLLIASAKASLVLWFFMHMKFERRLIKISFLSTMFFLGIMISFIFWDIAFR